MGNRGSLVLSSTTIKPDMKTVKIQGEIRKSTGKRDSDRLRKKGYVPCVLYGGGETIHFSAHENDFRDLVYTPKMHLVELDLDGKIYPAVKKEIQFHPVTDRILHIDFLEASEGKKLTVNIPIQLTGSAIGVKNGGKMRQKRRYLSVNGLAKDLPDMLEIDISDIDIGETIKIGDLSYENLELMDTPRAMVVQVISSRLAEKGMVIEEAVEEEEVLEEGEEVEGAEATEAQGEDKAPESEESAEKEG
jgi:large subunit ribosomal protein L25